MSEKEEFGADHAQRMLTAWKALKAGKMKVAPHLEKQAAEFIAVPLLMSGLVDTSGLSDGTDDGPTFTGRSPRSG